ncbi:hypothetical protein LLS1_33290 [Leifsonia sp. LS1]|uniref:hypothetical protein n=1 Tax=Leifsonia sp. LS1 TaxID=2828483 RepID=UPI001CFE1F61|nr:hypothetical protein [Leifsonia sp. LS1]GIT81660.1 hypothetical protein LLS1_33290 [Leifsonia sp. LS1]
MSDIAHGAPGPDLPGPGPHPQGPAAAADPAPPLPKPALYGSIGAVWAVSVVLAFLIGFLSPRSGYGSWLSLALGVSVLLAFAAQLATQRKDGFVNRLAATLTGSFLILGVTGAILALLPAAS